MISVTVKRY